MIGAVPAELCSGCGACRSVCPIKAIHFEKQEDGFLYPVVDKTCVSCGICLKTCPVIRETAPVDREAVTVLAAQNRDEKQLLASSSGGVFVALAEMILADGGIVFGAAWDTDFQLRHRAVEHTEDLSLLMGSKYVQSEIGDAYILVKHYLEQQKPVLFSGTPCQVRGLRAFLKEDYVNLYTVDIVCHGVPSQDSLNRYTAEIKKSKKAALSQATVLRRH